MSKKKRNTNEQKSICDRFREALDILEVNPNSSYSALGYNTPATLYSVVAGRCLPDLTKLTKLSKMKTPSGHRINLDWLITGKGVALLGTDKTSVKTLGAVHKVLSDSSKQKIEALSILLNTN